MRLFNLLFQAHFECTFRDNCSTMALQQAAFGSGKLANGIIAALACLGETHGPIEEAYEVLKSNEVREGTIPGWGNSFIRGEVDPAFLKVDQFIESTHPRLHSRLREITDTLHARGKQVFPNPAAYTAAAAIILGMPQNLAPLLFIQARTQAWGFLYHRLMTQQKPSKEMEAV